MLATDSIRNVATAAGRSRWAFVVFPGDGATQREADELFVRVTRGLLKTNRIDIVERAHLQDVMDEQRLSRSAAADPASAARFGKLVGASDCVYVELSLDDTTTNGPNVTVHRLDANASFMTVAVETTRIVMSGVAQGSGQRDEVSGGAGSGSVPTLRLKSEALEECADDLLTQLTTA